MNPPRGTLCYDSRIEEEFTLTGFMNTPRGTFRYDSKIEEWLPSGTFRKLIDICEIIHSIGSEFWLDRAFLLVSTPAASGSRGQR